MDIVYDAGDMINVGIELGQIEGTDLKNLVYFLTFRNNFLTDTTLLITNKIN